MPRRERPLDTGDSELIRFATELRQLRRQAGGPSYRAMAVRAHYSAASLSEAASGRKLPTLPLTLAYVRACGGQVPEWENRWRELAAAQEEPAQEDPARPRTEPERAPYVGLAAFQAEDAELFFGREDLVAELEKLLAGHRVVAVFGASGAGKSSVLRAGLAPRLGAGRVVVFTPGAAPLAAFAERVDPAAEELVIIVDQFEEVFTRCPDGVRRREFVDALLAAAEGRHRVVLGVRADFHAHCTAYPELMAAVRDSQVTVGPMTPEELHRAISQPAVRAGYSLESKLLSTLIAEAGARPGALPLLSHVLLETWQRRNGNALRLNAYRAAGGIDGALALTAERWYGELDPAGQRLARDLLLRLTTLGEGTEDTRRRLSPAELDTAEPALAVLLEQLVEARLVTRGQDGIELTHDALIRAWPRLRDWLAEDREALRTHRRLTESAWHWQNTGREAGTLYRGAPLAAAQELADRPETVLSVTEQWFLHTSHLGAALEQARTRRRQRRLHRLIALLSALLVTTVAATGYAFSAREQLAEQRNTAIAAKVAGQAAALRAADPSLAAQLSLAAYRLAPTVETRSALLSVFATPYANTLTGHTGNVNAVALSPDGRLLASASTDHTVRLWLLGTPNRPQPLATLTAHTGPVRAVTFHPGGHLLATAGWDHTVRLWDIGSPAQPRELTTLPHGSDVNAVAFSPNGALLATAATDGTVRLHGVTTPARAASADLMVHSGRKVDVPVVLTGHQGSVVALTFSPDGRQLASAGWDSTARLWDLANSQQPTAGRTLRGHTGPVTTVAFSPDGRTLATGGSDHTARLWNLQTASAATLSGHSDSVRAVTFSPDGRTLASASHDRAIRLWRVADQAPLTTLPGHTGPVVGAAFTPDGHTLATAADDHTVRLWQLPGPLLSAHTGPVYGAAFTPDGNTLATAGQDRTIHLWDTRDPHRPQDLATLHGHEDLIRWVAFSPNGDTLASTGHDRVLRLWEVDSPRHARLATTLAGHTKATVLVAFSPDGGLAASTGDDNTVRLWSLTDSPPRQIAVLDKHTDAVTSVDFAPDGRTLATAGYDRTVRLWNLADPAHPTQTTVLNGHTSTVNSARFSPDGRLLATAGYDRVAHLWELAQPQTPLATITDHTDAVHSATFGPDGRTLATASADRTARLWRLADPRHPEPLAVLTGHTDRVYLAAYRPDGRALATVSEDHTARLWETDPDRVAERVCALVSPAITEAEWRRYFGELAFRPPC